jgi:hypothetical protein
VPVLSLQGFSQDNLIEHLLIFRFTIVDDSAVGYSVKQDPFTSAVLGCYYSLCRCKLRANFRQIRRCKPNSHIENPRRVPAVTEKPITQNDVSFPPDADSTTQTSSIWPEHPCQAIYEGLFLLGSNSNEVHVCAAAAGLETTAEQSHLLNSRQQFGTTISHNNLIGTIKTCLSTYIRSLYRLPLLANRILSVFICRSEEVNRLEYYYNVSFYGRLFPGGKCTPFFRDAVTEHRNS